MANSYLPRNDVLYRGDQSRQVQGYTTRMFEESDLLALELTVNTFLETLPATISGNYVPHVISVQYSNYPVPSGEMHVAVITLYLSGSLSP